MAPLRSDLTMAGMLYAGCDFKEWADRARATLRVHGIPLYRDGNLGGSPLYELSSTGAVHIILCSTSLVSAQVLARIPANIRPKPRELWSHLQAQSKPFRLLELPVELRNSIYHIAFDRKSHCITPKGHSRFHPLLHVSKQIRQETLPLYWALTPVTMLSSSYMWKQAPIEQDVDVRITSWIETASKSHARHLRTLQFTLMGKRVTGSIGRMDRKLVCLSLTFGESEGLRVEVIRGNLSPHSLSRLQQHVARVERDRKIVNIQGECILLALLSEPNIWNQLELEWE